MLQRNRLLPVRLVVYFVLAICLFSGQSYEEATRLLTAGVHGVRSGMMRSQLAR